MKDDSGSNAENSFDGIQEIARKDKSEGVNTQSNIKTKELSNSNGICKACGDKKRVSVATQLCQPCRTFYNRHKDDFGDMKCVFDNGECDINHSLRTLCGYCRFHKCNKIEMEYYANNPAGTGQDIQENCKICGDMTDRTYLGVRACQSCEKCYQKHIKKFDKMKCSTGNGDCQLNVVSRIKCPYCRVSKCIQLGMRDFLDKKRSLRQESLPNICVICGDGVGRFKSFGVWACRSCCSFYLRNRLKNWTKCAKTCEINVENRNKCKPCRVYKCIEMGMKRNEDEPSKSAAVDDEGSNSLPPKGNDQEIHQASGNYQAENNTDVEFNERLKDDKEASSSGRSSNMKNEPATCSPPAKKSETSNELIDDGSNEVGTFSPQELAFERTSSSFADDEETSKNQLADEIKLSSSSIVNAKELILRQIRLPFQQTENEPMDNMEFSMTDYKEGNSSGRNKRMTDESAICPPPAKKSKIFDELVDDEDDYDNGKLRSFPQKQTSERAFFVSANSVSIDFNEEYVSHNLDKRDEDIVQMENPYEMADLNDDGDKLIGDGDDTSRNKNQMEEDILANEENVREDRALSGALSPFPTDSNDLIDELGRSQEDSLKSAVPSFVRNPHVDQHGNNSSSLIARINRRQSSPVRRISKANSSKEADYVDAKFSALSKKSLDKTKNPESQAKGMSEKEKDSQNKEDQIDEPIRATFLKISTGRKQIREKLISNITKSYELHCRYSVLKESRSTLTLKRLHFSSLNDRYEEKRKYTLLFFQEFSKDVKSILSFLGSVPYLKLLSKEEKIAQFKKKCFPVWSLWCLFGIGNEKLILPDGKYIDRKGLRSVFSSRAANELFEMPLGFYQLDLDISEIALLIVVVFSKSLDIPVIDKDTNNQQTVSDFYGKILKRSLLKREFGEDIIEELTKKIRDLNVLNAWNEELIKEDYWDIDDETP